MPESPPPSQQEAERRANQFLSRQEQGNPVVNGQDMITFCGSGAANDLRYLNSHQRSSSQFHLSPGVRSKSRIARGSNHIDHRGMAREQDDEDKEIDDEYEQHESKAVRSSHQRRRNSNNSPFLHSSRYHTKNKHASGSRYNRLTTTPEQMQVSRGNSYRKSRRISAGKQQTQIKQFANGLSLEFNWKINIHSLSHKRRHRGDRDSSHRSRSDIKSRAWGPEMRGLTSSKKLHDRRYHGRRFEEGVSPIKSFPLADRDDSALVSPHEVAESHEPSTKRQKTHHSLSQMPNQLQPGHFPQGFPMYPPGASNYVPVFFPPHQGSSNAKQTQSSTLQRTPTKKEASINGVPKMLPNTLSSHDYETILAFMRQQQFAASYHQMFGWHQQMAQNARDESSSPSQPSGSRMTKTKTVSGTNGKDRHSSSKKSKAAGAKTSSAASDDDDEDGEEESQENEFQAQNGLIYGHPYPFFPPWLYPCCATAHHPGTSPLKFYQEHGAFFMQNGYGGSSSSKSQMSKLPHQHHQIDEIIPEESPSRLGRSTSQRRRYHEMHSGDRARPDERTCIKQRSSVAPSEAHEASQAKLGAAIGCSPQHTGTMYGRQNLMGSAASQQSSSFEQPQQNQQHNHNCMQHWQNGAHGMPQWYMRPGSLGDGKQQMPMMFPTPFSFPPPGAWQGQQGVHYSVPYLNQGNMSNQKMDGEVIRPSGDQPFTASEPINQNAEINAAKSDERQVAQQPNEPIIVVEESTSNKKDGKTNSKSQRAAPGANGRSTGTKRARPYEADKVSKEDEKTGTKKSENPQPSSKKRVQKANKKEAMAQSTPSKRKRNCQKTSPSQIGKAADDYDHTFDRPDDLNKTTTQKQKVKPAPGGTDSTFFQITPPKQDIQQMIPATADRAQDRRLAQGVHDQQLPSLGQLQPTAILDSSKDGMSSCGNSAALQMPPFNVPEDYQVHSDQANDLKDEPVIEVVGLESTDNVQYMDADQIDGDRFGEERNPGVHQDYGLAANSTVGVTADESAAGTIVLSNLQGFANQLQIGGSENASNVAHASVKKPKRRPRKQAAGTADAQDGSLQCTEKKCCPQADSAGGEFMQLSVNSGCQRKLTSQQREDAQRMNDKKIEDQTMKVMSDTMTQEDLFLRIASGLPTVTKCKGCKCRKGHCLKRYCECLRNNATCGSECGCRKHATCKNLPGSEHSEVRKAAIMEILRRKFDAFEPKVDISNAHASGCNCKNSRCQKGYCECFERGVPCTEKCKCIGCRNPLGQCSSSACAPSVVAQVKAEPIAAKQESIEERQETVEHGSSHADTVAGGLYQMQQQEERAAQAMSQAAASVTPVVSSAQVAQQQSAPFVVNRQQKKPRLHAPHLNAEALLVANDQSGILPQPNQACAVFSDAFEQQDDVNVLKAYREADDTTPLLLKIEEQPDSISNIQQMNTEDMEMKIEQEDLKCEDEQLPEHLMIPYANELLKQNEQLAQEPSPMPPVDEKVLAAIEKPKSKQNSNKRVTSSQSKKRSIPILKTQLQTSATLSNKENHQLSANHGTLNDIQVADFTEPVIPVRPTTINSIFKEAITDQSLMQQAEIDHQLDISIKSETAEPTVLATPTALPLPSNQTEDQMTQQKKKKRRAPAVQEKIITRSMRRGQKE